MVALLLVPVAGAAEPPYGLAAAGLTALVLLGLVPFIGRRVPWGWLTLLVAGAGLVVPRGQVAAIGPAFLVGTALCVVMWLANRGGGRRRGHDRDREPPPGTPERAAQLLMGLSGERQVAQLVARELPETYVLINGLTLPRGAGDIDHLVVGPTGVFLLETKTMAGVIVCEPDGTWRRTRVGRGGTAYAAFIGDPATQVQRNIFAMRQCLRRRLPRLLRQTPLWIEGLVVFPHTETELHTEHSRIPAIRLDQAPDRICQHAPRRALRPAEVDALVEALLDEVRYTQPAGSVRQTAQSLVEMALILPVVLTLVFGTVAISRLVQAQTAVVAVAHSAARAGALGASPQDAIDRMRQRVLLLAPGLGLDSRAIVFEWDVTRFAEDPPQVLAIVHYPVDFGDLPLAGWIGSRVVRAEHIEWVDPFRSGVSVQTDVAD